MKKYQKKYQKKEPKRTPMTTDWDQVAKWYDSLVGEKGSSYQQDVIFPGALKLMKPKLSDTILDLACGQGVFCRELAQRKYKKVIGVDASQELIDLAQKRSPRGLSFFLQDAKKISSLPLPKIDIIVSLLAIQNMDPLDEVFRECTKVLKEDGRLVLMMTHPCFRIPRQSHWEFSSGQSIQYRRIDRYLGELKVPIVAHPGKNPDLYTWSFHRPLQSYIQALVNAGFLIDGLEEFVSNKTSQSGPKAKAENRARNEIPLFLGLSAKKISLGSHE